MSEKSSTFTTRDMELFAVAMQSTKEEIPIDYAKFAAKGGFANANSAKAVWHGLKKKLAKASGDADTAASPAATASPAKGKKRKAAAASDGREDGAGATPAKTRAKGGRKSKKPRQEEAEAQTNGDATPDAKMLVETRVKVEDADEIA